MFFKEIITLIESLQISLAGFNIKTSVLVVLATVLIISTLILAYRRRIKSSGQQAGQYFTHKDLMSPPIKRPAYSDRMAYILSEMSELAYYKFENNDDLISDAIKSALSTDMTLETNIYKFLKKISSDLISKQSLNIECFKSILEKSGFKLLGTINVDETQGFVCKRNVANEPSYVIVAFRGTEKKISDWLTDAHAVPKIQGLTKVHTGFFEALTVKIDKKNKTAKDRIQEILNLPEAQDKNGNLLPLFITGHSLGGALALLTTKLIAPDVNGACYTFGAPRVGNYSYFEEVKTPVYRVVNSSDIVPRVPPGAIMMPVLFIIQILSWATNSLPFIPLLLDKVEQLIDKLKGYRHFGDLRYLTDIAEGEFHCGRSLH